MKLVRHGVPLLLLALMMGMHEVYRKPLYDASINVIEEFQKSRTEFSKQFFNVIAVMGDVRIFIFVLMMIF